MAYIHVVICSIKELSIHSQDAVPRVEETGGLCCSTARQDLLDQDGGFIALGILEIMESRNKVVSNQGNHYPGN